MSVDRDRILEQALKHELRRDTAVTPQCLDAETLAAWQDDTLNAAQAEAIELHVSTCARCQAMVGAFARGTLGTSGTSPTPGTVGTEGTSGTFSWWKWWLAPIAAGAVAVTLWMVVPEEQQIATRAPQPQATIALDKPAPQADFEQKNNAPAPADRANQAENRAREADADFNEKKLKVDIARDDRQQQLKDQALPAPKEEVAVAQAPPAAPPTAGYRPVAPAAAPAPAARAEAADARVGELQKSARLAFAPLEVPTLNRNVRWRIAGDRIERTDDAGQTWTTKRDRPNEGIAAGSAPSPSVAWFVGRAGLVLLTGDAGATFAEVSLAEPLDLTSVSATDIRTAVIVTVGGRRFRTDDAGLTWRPF